MMTDVPRTFLLAMSLLLLADAPTPAQACSYPAFAPHVISPSARETDRTPPSLTAAPSLRVLRGRGPQMNCDGTTSATSCDDIGTVLLTPAASDDQTPPSELGVRVRLVSGTPPADMRIPAEDVRLSAGAIGFHWNDDSQDRQEAISFTLEVAMVDAAGNVSGTTQVPVHDTGSEGCAFIPRRSPAPVPLVAVGLGFLLALIRRARRPGASGR
jgi:hypothetical protein